MKTFLITTIAFLAFSLTCKAQWTTATPNIYNSNAGNVLIGTTTSSIGALQISGGVDLLSLFSNGTNPAQFNAWNSPDFRIIQRSNGIMTLWTNTIERMRIDQAGNVGIGTTTPAGKLDLAVNNPNGDGFAIRNLNNSAYATFQVNGTIGSSVPNWANSMVFESVPYSNGGLVLSSYTGNITFQTNNRNNRMTITSAGYVGIGTATPDQALSVNGTIHSKSVVVDASIFPDYVFNPNYKLPTLAAVKTYIDKNHHLPDVPSATEVEKSGLNLGEMNKLLVQKVEELTLYLIEQNKQLSEQNMKLVDQQKINQVIEQQSKLLKSQQEQIDELKRSLSVQNYKKSK